MTAPLHHPVNGHKLADPQAVFAERCGARALLVINGAMSLHEAVDELQAYAELSGLIDLIGQDAAQDIMGAAFIYAEMVPDDLDEACDPEAFDGADDIVKRWQLADPRDRWLITGEAPPPKAIRNADISGTTAKPKPYRTPQATIDAFWYVARQGDANQMRDWLENHPRDKSRLLELLKNK